MTLPDINQVSEDYADFLLAQLDRAVAERDRYHDLLRAREMLNTGLRAEMTARGLERDRANIALAKVEAERDELRDELAAIKDELDTDGKDT